MHTCDSLDRNASHRPTKLALVDGAARSTWSEVRGRVNGLGEELRKCGVRQFDRVAVLAENAGRIIELTYAIQQLGAITVPLNPRWVAREVEAAIADAGIRVACVDSKRSSTLNGLSPSCREGLTALALEALDFSASQSCSSARQDVLRRRDPSGDIASIFYTGGTTGRAKGVMLSHANHVLHSMALAAEIGLEDSIQFLHAAPMFHIADALFIHLVSFVAGAHFVIPHFDAIAFAEAIAEFKITDTILVPSMIQMVLADERSAETSFSTLKRLYYGGSPMPAAVLRHLVERFPKLQLFQFYGQTESSPVLTVLRPEFHGMFGTQTDRMFSAGRALFATDVRVVDTRGELVEIGGVGEIVARGPQVMLGYWNRPLESDAALRGGWLRTGDAGRMDRDGFLYVTDRLKDMIITGGENVYSIEVEQAIYEMTEIAQCCVIGLPDDRWGEMVQAVVVAKSGEQLTESAVISHCATRLAAYKRPKSVVVWTEPLPQSGAGKILKEKIRESLKVDSNVQRSINLEIQ